MRKKIAFIAPYPKAQAPSQRFRFEQYLSFLEAESFDVELYPFLNDKTWNTLYKEGATLSKIFGILGSFRRRFGLIFKLRKFDYIFIHREASMVGPPIFEWIISKVLKKPFIYDFDDAIWLPNYSQSNARFQRLKAYGKVRKIAKWAHVITTGNEFLANFARQYNANVEIIPTTIDLVNVHNQRADQNKTPINIVWTGTHTTMNYLEPLIPILKELEQKHAFTFTVISNQAPTFKLDALRFVKWNRATEISDLANAHIGVMPLIENEWSQGKCAFKGLQYMALSIPAVLSPVGMNNEVIQHERNGFLCDSPEEWKETLEKLIVDATLRSQIGSEGYKTIAETYSVEANKAKYLKLFQA